MTKLFNLHFSTTLSSNLSFEDKLGSEIIWGVRCALAILRDRNLYDLKIVSLWLYTVLLVTIEMLQRIEIVNFEKYID